MVCFFISGCHSLTFRYLSNWWEMCMVSTFVNPFDIWPIPTRKLFEALWHDAGSYKFMHYAIINLWAGPQSLPKGIFEASWWEVYLRPDYQSPTTADLLMRGLLGAWLSDSNPCRPFNERFAWGLVIGIRPLQTLQWGFAQGTLSSVFNHCRPFNATFAWSLIISVRPLQNFQKEVCLGPHYQC